MRKSNETGIIWVFWKKNFKKYSISQLTPFVNELQMHHFDSVFILLRQYYCATRLGNEIYTSQFDLRHPTALHSAGGGVVNIAAAKTQRKEAVHVEFSNITLAMNLSISKIFHTTKTVFLDLWVLGFDLHFTLFKSCWKKNPYILFLHHIFCLLDVTRCTWLIYVQCTMKFLYLRAN